MQKEFGGRRRWFACPRCGKACMASPAGCCSAVAVSSAGTVMACGTSRSMRWTFSIGTLKMEKWFPVAALIELEFVLTAESSVPIGSTFGELRTTRSDSIIAAC
jgi:hypothetical protein